MRIGDGDCEDDDDEDDDHDDDDDERQVVHVDLLPGKKGVAAEWS